MAFNADILLRILGENSDAIGDLNEVERELAEFDRINAEAIARVDVQNRDELRRAMADLNAWGRTRRNAVAALAVQGQAALARAIAQLNRWGRMRETAVANLRVTGGEAGMNMLRQWSRSLRMAGSDVDSLKRRMPGLSLQAAHLAGDFQRSGGAAQFASNGMRILGTSTRQASGGVRYLGSSYRSMSRILMNPNVPNSAKALVIGLMALKGAGRAVGLAMMGVHAAILPLAAGGIAAAGALGGMAVAGGAVGIVLKGLSGVFTNTWGAAERYNQAVVTSGKNSKEAKAALKELEATVGQGGAVAAQAAQKYSVFKQALAKALQPATLNMWKAMNVVYSNATKLVPAYAAQVNHASQALLGFFKWIMQAPRIAQMNTILQSMTGIWGPLGDAAKSVAQILLNIAQAAMPFLISTVKLLAADLSRLAGALTVDRLSAAFAVMHQWLLRVRATALLAGQIIGELFRQILPHAARAHDLLQKIGQDFLNWLKSEEGRRTIKDFFDKVVPLADKVVRAAGAIGKAFLTWYPIIATVLGPLADIVKFIFDRLSDLGNLVKGLPGPMQAAFGLIALAIWSLLPAIIGIGAKMLLWRFIAKRAAAGIAAELAGSAAAQTAAGSAAGGAAGSAFRTSLLGRLVGIGAAITATIGVAGLQVTLSAAFRSLGGAAVTAFGGAGALGGLPTRAKFIIQQTVNSIGTTNPLFWAVGSLLGGATQKGLQSTGPRVHIAGRNLAQSGAQGLRAGAPIARSAGVFAGQQGSAGIRQAAPTARSAGVFAGRSGASGLGATRGQFGSAGRAGGTAGVSGLRGTGGRFGGAGRSVGGSGAGGVRSTAGAFRGAGGTVGGASVSGVSSKGGSMQSAGRTVGDKGKSGVANTQGGWNSVGKSLIDGVGKAIEDGAGALLRIAERVAREAWNAAKRIVSGSPPFYGLGVEFMEGWAKGIRAAGPQVVAAAAAVAKQASAAARRQPFPNSVLNRGTTPEGDLRDSEITSKELAEALKNDLKGSVNTFAQKINELVDKLRENNQQIRFLNSQAMVSREMMNRLLTRQLYQPYVNGSILRGSDVDFEKSPVTAAPQQTFNIHTPGNAAMDHVTAATAFGQLIRYQGIT